MGRKKTGRSTDVIRVPKEFKGMIKLFLTGLKRRKIHANPLPESFVQFFLQKLFRDTLLIGAMPAQTVAELKTWKNETIDLFDGDYIAARRSMVAAYGEENANFFFSLPNASSPWFLSLQVSRDASYNEVKNAYRKMAATFHPDRNPNPEALDAMVHINRAWEEYKKMYKPEQA